MTDEQEVLNDGPGLGIKDFAHHRDVEASPGKKFQKGSKDKAMNRTISFQEGDSNKAIRRRKARSASVSTIGTTDEEDDDEDDLSDDGQTTNDGDTIYDEDDDDGRSLTFTENSDMSDDEPDDSHRRRNRFTPGFVSRTREKRRRRRRERAEARELDELERDIQIKSYRRTPVLTGVIAPFSIMLEIPGFTSRWYVNASSRSLNPVYRPNPPILDVGLSFSLAGALIANVAILGRFSERLTPRTATLTAGIFLIVHDIINAVALIAFGVIHAVNDGYTYSEAYWMTAAATGASLICTTSLIFDYVSTKNFRNAGSGLTPKQAQLVMVIMAFLAYISISAMIYAIITPLPFLDSMYFMVETLATVGLGDITPTSLGGRVALFFIAPGGIIILAVVVGISRQTIIEEFENAYKRRRALYKQRVAEKAEEKKRNRHLRIKLKRGSGRGGTSAVHKPKSGTALTLNPTMSTIGTSNSIDAPSLPPITVVKKPALPVPAAKTADGSRWFGGTWSGGFSRRGANVPREEVVEMGNGNGILDEKDRFRSSPLSSSTDLNGGLQGGAALLRTDTTATTTSELREAEAALIAQRQEIEQNFHKFRKELAKAERNEFWIKLSVAAILFACFWVLGGAIFSTIEGWTYFQGFYFVFVVFTSIGYGDFSPKTSGGRAFFIVWGLLGVGTLTILFSVVSDAWANRVQQRKLAGEKVKKKSKWSKLADKVRGNKGRERRRIKVLKKEEDEEERRKEGEGQGDANGEGSPEKNSEQASLENEGGPKVGGGILLDPSKHQTSSIEEESKEEEVPLDANQLHMEFTNSAMEFHRSALDFMTQNRSNVVDAFRHIPEMSEIAAKVAEETAKGQRQKISEQDRKRLLDAVKETHDATALQSTHQWLLIQDFEHTLHLLVDKSSTFQNEVNRVEGLLKSARDEIHDLKSRHHHPHLLHLGEEKEEEGRSEQQPTDGEAEAGEATAVDDRVGGESV